MVWLAFRIFEVTKLNVMRIKLMTLCMALGCLCLNAFAQVPNYVPTDGLVAWYPFNGNANDGSGNGNDGENEGAILHENRFSESASAYFFSESDFISLPVIAVSTSFSASFWISPVEGSTDSDAILDGGQGKFIRIVPSLVSEDWRLGYNSECIGNPTATSEFSLNSWVHGALTFDGDSLHFFQDGVKQNAIEHCASDWSFQFIGFADNGEHGFDGVIDDLGIWNRALTEEEILALYIAELPISGCTDSIACNFNADANIENDNCVYPLFGEDCETGGAACGEGTIWDSSLQSCVGFDQCPSDLNDDGIVGINDLLSLLSDFGTMCEEPETGEFTCGHPMNYHGYDYATVQIGEQCWFAENLRSAQFTDGSAIPTSAVDPFGDNAANIDAWGLMYEGTAVIDSRGLCPSDWHISSNADWQQLINYAANNGYSGDESSALKSASGWSSGANGSDAFGFNAKPGGFHYNPTHPYWGEFNHSMTSGYWWTSTVQSASESIAWTLQNDYLTPSYYHSNGMSVRCLKD